MSKINSP